MPLDLKTITLQLPFHLGSVNCYLIRTASGFLLVDTGGKSARKDLDRQLEQAGCLPGTLDLVLLTHGDFDHCGNAAYLRSAYGTRIAMHPGDAGMVERGDMFLNRKKPNALVRALVPLLMGFAHADRFSPDVLLADGYDLTPHGLEAKVISLPGHSPGSIGILTAEGDFFCGDLYENMNGPVLNSIMDDPEAANNSIAYLLTMKICKVYPGHGRPF